MAINLKSIRRYEVVEASDYDDLYQEYASALDRETQENDARLDAEAQVRELTEEIERLEAKYNGATGE